MEGCGWENGMCEGEVGRYYPLVREIYRTESRRRLFISMHNKVDIFTASCSMVFSLD